MDYRKGYIISEYTDYTDEDIQYFTDFIIEHKDIPIFYWLRIYDGFRRRTLKELIEFAQNKDNHTYDHYKLTPLMFCAEYSQQLGLEPFIRILIDAGANINLQNNETQNRTALMHLMRKSYTNLPVEPEIFQLFIDAGADLNLEDDGNDGSNFPKTALIYYVNNNWGGIAGKSGRKLDVNILKLFFENGAKLEIEHKYDKQWRVLFINCIQSHDFSHLIEYFLCSDDNTFTPDIRTTFIQKFCSFKENIGTLYLPKYIDIIAPYLDELADVLPHEHLQNLKDIALMRTTMAVNQFHKHLPAGLKRHIQSYLIDTSKLV